MILIVFKKIINMILYLIHLTFSVIDNTFLQNLINSKIPESKILDYKRDKIGRKDNDKKEFLFDISSFANADSGNLILGIDEEENEERHFR